MMTMDENIESATDGRGLPRLAQSRAYIYGILSTVYTGIPAGRLVGLLQPWSITGMQLPRGTLPPKMKRGLKAIGVWREKCGPQPSEIAALDTEFTRLFRGLHRSQSPPPPYESVYCDEGLLYGPSTQQVMQKYRHFQLEAQVDEPPDHIATELDFMRFLCDRESRLWEAGGAHTLIKEEDTFLRAHLSRWVPAFCEKIRRLDTTSFYTGLADITEGWISCDRQIIHSIKRLPEYCALSEPQS